jgi:hypothetical protein
VRRADGEPGVDVRDPDAIGRVVCQVQAAVNRWAQDQLGRGVSSRQLQEATQGYEFQLWLVQRIQEGLAPAAPTWPKPSSRRPQVALLCAVVGVRCCASRLRERAKGNGRPTGWRA